MDARDVAGRLRLGPDHAAWLRQLEALGPPPGGLAELSVENMDRLGLEAVDQAAVLAAQPASPEWCWLLAHGVPDAISWATLADLGQHVRLTRRRTGQSGLDTQDWISLHYRGGIFALGRLQFQPYHLQTGPDGPLFWYEDRAEAGFRRGDPSLSLHIPESGPLTPAACVESFRLARTFFAERFPEYAGALVTCTSWLLD